MASVRVGATSLMGRPIIFIAANRAMVFPDTAFGREGEGCRVVKRLFGNNLGNSLGETQDH